MSFVNVIDEKIFELRSRESLLKNSIISPQYHSAKILASIESVIPAIHALDATADEMKQEVVSILNQIPHLSESIWNSAISDIKNIEGELVRWENMKALYLDWVADEQKKEAKEQEIKEKIANDKIKEPTKLSSIRRRAGTKPEISLGNYRRLQSKLDGGEDQ